MEASVVATTMMPWRFIHRGVMGLKHAAPLDRHSSPRRLFGKPTAGGVLPGDHAKFFLRFRPTALQKRPQIYRREGETSSKQGGRDEYSTMIPDIALCRPQVRPSPPSGIKILNG
jgi:hypothetical protein